jgi:hypothetical protein
MRNRLAEASPPGNVRFLPLGSPIHSNRCVLRAHPFRLEEQYIFMNYLNVFILNSGGRPDVE